MSAEDIARNIKDAIRVGVQWIDQAYQEINKPETQRHPAVNRKLDILLGQSNKEGMKTIQGQTSLLPIKEGN
jgi:hypothetical protein